MKPASLFILSILGGAGFAQTQPPPLAATQVDSGLLSVKRVYVEQLKGGVQADSLRELIISSLNATGLFVMTDNAERADAILKGAADDHSYEDIHDIQEGINARQNASIFGGSLGTSSSGSSIRGNGASGGISIGDEDSRHIKERKDEAYAAVHLCNRDGDILWSTTQESPGGKFRGASADVAAKIARQLVLDMERARRATTAPSQTAQAPAPAKP